MNYFDFTPVAFSELRSYLPYVTVMPPHRQSMPTS